MQNCPDLDGLYCFGNQLTSLDLSKNTKLSWISCFRNSIKELDFSNCPNIIDVIRNGTRYDNDGVVRYDLGTEYPVVIFDNTVSLLRIIFTDVADPSAYYYKPVYWAVDNGITAQ